MGSLIVSEVHVHPFIRHTSVNFADTASFYKLSYSIPQLATETYSSSPWGPTEICQALTSSSFISVRDKQTRPIVEAGSRLVRGAV
ncbi:hypothetical protein G6F68_016230 [Rhizopus microsporus]|nr:hypothetical protein G6F68_016230 [Rhizopus microsporus]